MPGPWTADLEALREDLGAKIDRVGAALVEQFAENRRHFDVVAEGLRSDIRLVAEGVVMVDEKLDRFRDEVRTQFGQVDQRFLRVEARLGGVEVRLGDVEVRLGGVEVRLGRVEARLGARGRR